MAWVRFSYIGKGLIPDTEMRFKAGLECVPITAFYSMVYESTTSCFTIISCLIYNNIGRMDPNPPSPGCTLNIGFVIWILPSLLFATPQYSVFRSVIIVWARLIHGGREVSSRASHVLLWLKWVSLWPEYTNRLYRWKIRENVYKVVCEVTYTDTIHTCTNQIKYFLIKKKMR